MNTSARAVWVLIIFSVAMAALESAVVVYLRALYYPLEFTVNFKLVDEHIILIELVRELATLIMLWAVAYMSGRDFKQRFAFFLLSFAVWDIFYYGWLKVFIDWPNGFFDWDILFLVPITWIGPVAAPLICSVTMIILAVVLLRLDHEIPQTTWICLTIGVLLILFTFTKDYGELILVNGLISEFPNLMTSPTFLAKAGEFSPGPYQWNVFLAGELMFMIGIVNYRIGRKISSVT
jgi:hypothetical protein